MFGAGGNGRGCAGLRPSAGRSGHGGRGASPSRRIVPGGGQGRFEGGLSPPESSPICGVGGREGNGAEHESGGSGVPAGQGGFHS